MERQDSNKGYQYRIDFRSVTGMTVKRSDRKGDLIQMQLFFFLHMPRMKKKMLSSNVFRLTLRLSCK